MLASEHVTDTCEICGGADDDEHMLLCDGCDCGFHMQCLSPPLTELPKSRSWFCHNCTAAALSTSGTSPRRLQVYEVASILNKRSSVGGVEYLIRWKVMLAAPQPLHLPALRARSRAKMSRARDFGAYIRRRDDHGSRFAHQSAPRIIFWHRLRRASALRTILGSRRAI